MPVSDSNQSADVVIIGGGVIGLAIARRLAQSGVKDLLLIERAELGSESSQAAGGMLAPQAEADCADPVQEIPEDPRSPERLELALCRGQFRQKSFVRAAIGISHLHAS